ncbi:MAG: hypothetical protein BMS9Abin28_0586 [Anaerolineae bacterium]|nr:MAG: hypothetical protein BMS9Abin28_0586 [Anaerolineae bacterium]
MQSEGSTPFRAAGRSAYVSSAVSAFGIAFLVLLYVGIFASIEPLGVFGPLNDLFVLVQYTLALPVVVAFHRILRPQSPRLSLVAMLVAVVGIVGVVVFQLLLITGAMSFLEQVAYASASILLVGVWIVITGFLGRRSGKLQLSVAAIILGALYFGYPLWAYRVGRQLLAGDRASTE